MEWKIWYITYVILVLGLTFKPCCGIEVDGNTDNCVISLVIPKESVKSSCSESTKSDLKLRSVEGIISQLRREVNEINVKLAYTLSPKSNSNKNVDDLIDKVNSLEKGQLASIQKRLSEIESQLKTIQNSGKIDHDITDYKKLSSSTFLKNLSRKKMAKVIKTIMKKELSGLEDKIKASIMDELQQQKDLSAAGVSQAHLKEDSVAVANAQSNRLYRYHHRQVPNKKDTLVSLTDDSSESKSADINPEVDKVMPKIRHESVQSAIDNEFPDVHEKTDIAQSDSDFGNGMHNVFEIFRAELKQGLATLRVKDITSRLTKAETKMSKLFKIINGMKTEYDKKFVPKTHENSGNFQGKIKELEDNISTLGRSIASMKENLFSDPHMEERFRQQQFEIVNMITSKFYQSDIPSKQDLEDLEVKVERAKTKVELTDASFKNYRADMRIKTLFMEQNISQLVNSIEYINETLFPDYVDAFDIDEVRREKEINSALKFVKEVKRIWPTIVYNVTEKDLMDENDRNEIDLQLVDINTKLNALRDADLKTSDVFSSMNYSINSLMDRIVDIEKFNLQNALEHDKWVRYNFECTYGRSGCFGGKKYIRKTRYMPAKYVGVVLCSATRYKIFLSDSLNSTFLDLGDTFRGGEDHCEFVGARRNSKVTIGRGDPIFDNIQGYKRRDWGQTPIKGTLSFYTPTPPWYECGVTIP